VRTETVSQPVELQRETVVIDRESFDGSRGSAEAQRMNAANAFQEKEIVINLKRQEPVVEVQPFLSGRIVAQKRTTTERQDVSRQVRQEQVDVVKSGNDQDVIVSENLNAKTTATGAPAAQQGVEAGKVQKQQQQPQPMQMEPEARYWERGSNYR